MRVVFAGTPDFSVPSLQALIESPVAEVVGVYSQPDRPAGRGKKTQQSPVKKLALSAAIDVLQPRNFSSDGVVNQLANLQPDLLVVTAYGLLLPPVVLALPRLGCVNIHASLLPRWRGAAPVQRAIEAGDSETGISLMQMEQGLDTGPVLATAVIPMADQETGASLHDRLSQLGGRVLTENLSALAAAQLVAEPQDDSRATYAKKLSRIESPLDWSLPGRVLERKIRAFNPWPGCTFSDHDNVIKVIEASYLETGTGVPGEILGAAKQGIVVRAGQGSLNLEKLQKPGGRPVRAGDFLNGYAISPGMILSLSCS